MHIYLKKKTTHHLSDEKKFRTAGCFAAIKESKKRVRKLFRFASSVVILQQDFLDIYMTRKKGKLIYVIYGTC